MNNKGYNTAGQALHPLPAAAFRSKPHGIIPFGSSLARSCPCKHDRDLASFVNKKAAIILFLCCCSCVSRVPVKEDRPYIYLANNSKYFLLPCGDIENSLDMAQRISAEWQGKDYLFNAWVKADEAGMEMTLLNELGANMGELSYRNGLLSFSSQVFPKSLKPEYIVADFQLCFYNTSALRHALQDCGLLFENTGNVRRIFQGKTVIIEIEKAQNTIRLVNYLRGYTYTLEGNFQ